LDNSTAPNVVLVVPAGQSLQALADAEPVSSMYFPVPQSVQCSEEPVVLLHFPASQATQLDNSTAPIVVLVVPAGQSLQALADAEPVSSMYFPVPQLSHWPEPGTEEYFPVGQSTHWSTELCSLATATISPFSSMIFPASQDLQALEELEPAFGLYLPPSQMLQEYTEVPRNSEKVPGGQFWQPDDWASPKPSLHFPFSQSVQLDVELAPVPALNLPAPQLLHEARPTSSAYFPAPQSKHSLVLLWKVAFVPMSSKCFPIPHDTQSDDRPAAVVLDHLPAPQTTQSEADCER
jgi:hypothetical protein